MMSTVCPGAIFHLKAFQKRAMVHCAGYPMHLAKVVETQNVGQLTANTLVDSFSPVGRGTLVETERWLFTSLQ